MTDRPTARKTRQGPEGALDDRASSSQAGWPASIYDVRLRDDDGREYSKTLLTKREAEEFEAAERTDRRRGERIDPRLARTRLSELADHWLQSNPAKRPRTLDRDREITGAAAAALGPSRRVVSVTRADVQRLVDMWRAELAPSTVRRMYSAVRAMFNYAEAAELIARSRCRHIRLPTAELVDRPALEVDQLAAVADGLGDHSPMVWLGAVLGLRWGEVAALTVDSFDFLHGSIAVTQQLGRDRKLSARSPSRDVVGWPLPRGCSMRSPPCSPPGV